MHSEKSLAEKLAQIKKLAPEKSYYNEQIKEIMTTRINKTKQVLPEVLIALEAIDLGATVSQVAVILLEQPILAKII